MRLVILLLMSFGFFQTAVAQSEPEVVARFRNAALTAVTRAESRGEVTVHNIPLVDLKKVIKTSAIVHYPNVTVRIANRKCARWQPGGKAFDTSSGRHVQLEPHIYLNPDCASLKGEELEGVSLHEFIGLGFNADRDYEISSRILEGGIVKSGTFNEDKAGQAKQKLERSRSGGSTGVGGGGDIDDLRFKLAGIRFLKKPENINLLGIPAEVLEYVIREMKISPAGDINNILEFRASGIEGPRSAAIIYASSRIYRDKDIDPDLLGLMAVTAAQVFVAYAAEDLGIADLDLHLDKDELKRIKKITDLRLQ